MQVPIQYKTGIQKILTVNDDSIGAIIEALYDFPPTLQIVGKIVERASETGRISRGDAYNIASCIVSLYTDLFIENDEPPSINWIASSIKQAIDEDDELSKFATNKEFGKFQQRLNSLLIALENIDSLIHTSFRASELLVEYERLFSEAKIVTDVRYLFDSETESKIQAAITVHNLKISYRDTQGVKEFYVAMDTMDLDELHAQIIVAIENRKALQLALSDAKIPHLNPESDENFE